MHWTIDQWRIGLTFVSTFLQYGLLAGVYPIYDICHDDQIGHHIKKGEKAYIDPLWSKESFAEAELVKAIYECWHWHAEHRPDIGELVLMLRESVDKNRDLIAKGLTKLEGDEEERKEEVGKEEEGDDDKEGDDEEDDKEENDEEKEK